MSFNPFDVGSVVDAVKQVVSDVVTPLAGNHDVSVGTPGADAGSDDLFGSEDDDSEDEDSEDEDSEDEDEDFNADDMPMEPHAVLVGSADHAKIFLRNMMTDEPAAGATTLIQFPDGSTVEMVADDDGVVQLPGDSGDTFALVGIKNDEEGHDISCVGDPEPIDT